MRPASESQGYAKGGSIDSVSPTQSSVSPRTVAKSLGSLVYAVSTDMRLAMSDGGSPISFGRSAEDAL